MYYRTPFREAEEMEAAGQMVIVLCTDPKTDFRNRIGIAKKPGFILTAYNAQWDEAPQLAVDQLCDADQVALVGRGS